MKTKLHKGSSTLEILIAFAILTLSLTAVISVIFGNGALAIDTETNTDALARAEELLEEARALATSDYLAVVSGTETEMAGLLEYTKTLTVEDVTPCKKQVTSTVSWDASPIRPLAVELSTFLTDVAGTLLVGGDCFLEAPPDDGWTNPQRFASDTFNPGKPYILDALDRFVYVALDKSPFLAVADTRSATLGQTNGLIIDYENGFDLDTDVNSLDAFAWTDPDTGDEKTYVFLATASTTAQLMVVDMTDQENPVLVATRGLSSCVSGSFPEGWYLAAHGDRLYFSTRETAGPEFHVFDIEDPANPSELNVGGSICRGYSLNSTVEQFVIRDQIVEGVSKRYAYMGTDQNAREIRVLDITNSLAIAETTSVDLAGNTDGASVHLVGTKLYFGRLSGTGADLYIYDIRNPASGLSLLGSQDIGTSVLGIRVAGNLAFLATGKTNQEFQVWNIKSPASITNRAIFNFGNVAGQGIDYEPDFIYITGQATPNFQILYSAP